MNISGIQFSNPRFVEEIMGMLELYDLKPESLEIEITERVLVSDFDYIYRMLSIFYDKGVHIALDDFGQGYSSLSYLKILPISTLKIDRSFVIDE